jgi:hypothetical protein
MRDLEQQCTKNASRLPSMYEGLTISALLCLFVAAPRTRAQSSEDVLPDAPSALLFSSSSAIQPSGLPDAAQNAQQQAQQETSSTPAVVIPPAQVPSGQAGPTTVPPCSKSERHSTFRIIFAPSSTKPTCQDPLQLVVDTGYVRPLTSNQKGLLAIRAVSDPFNLLTIAAFSGISVAADSHSVYGPGFAGWGRFAGYSLAEDIQAEFTGVYLIPSLVREDPRYHRMPKASVRRRIAHALIHTLVSQHDDGSLMPNYATLINVPLSAEISNLYVPGIGTNAPDTAKRILVGYSTEPVGPLLAEFLPDFAKRVHVHIIFGQQILNRLALGSGGDSSAF